MTTIRKAMITSFGGPESVTVTTGDIPPPPPGHVQVRILYSGFSGSDINMRLGRYPMQPPAPLVPGYQFAGLVVCSGPGSTRFAPGTPVCTISVTDSEAELINIDEKYIVVIPPALAATDDGMQQACAAVLDWHSAWDMVSYVAQVKPGQKVFVHGMSGAVGYALMVLSLRAGAEVYGTASARNHDELRALGATPMVYTDKKWMEYMQSLGGAHVIFDPLGFESWDESYDILASEGLLVGYGGNKGSLDGGGKDAGRSPWPQMAKLMARGLKVWQNKRTYFYYISRERDRFIGQAEAVLGLIAEGHVRVPIKKIWELSEESLREAHEGWGKTPGMGSMLVRIARSY